MSNSPKVSVCMPMYNASRYLRECIDSVLAQTFTDFEFLIADDGSEDDSVSIVESYSDSRIRLIKQEHDYIATLNCLLDEANGEYIARMDADDIMHPQRLHHQVSVLQQHSEIDILGAKATCNFNDMYNDFSFNNRSLTLTHVTLFDFAKHNSLTNPTSMMRREKISKAALRYDRAYPFAEDYKFWIDALMAGLSIYNSPLKIIYYRESPYQVSNRFAADMNEQAQIISEYCQDFLSTSSNRNYTPPNIQDTTNLLTIIIPFLNEGQELINTVENLRNVCRDRVDIMVINDHSYDSFDYIDKLKNLGVIYLYNIKRQGVAKCRDMGISLMKTPYFLLLDGHMRIYSYENIKTLEILLSQNDRCILCGQSVPLDSKGGKLVLRDRYSKGYGAFNPLRKGRLLPDVEWCQTEHNTSSTIEEVPTVLGAAYAGSKRYWTHIRGLNGLKSYGFDESYISFKVWLEGGKCLLLKDFITGHLYRNESPYSTLNADMIYNSMYLCCLFYNEREFNHTRAFGLASNYTAYKFAYLQFENNLPSIIESKEYYKSIAAYDYMYVRAKHTNETKRIIAQIESLNDTSPFNSPTYLRQEIDNSDNPSLIDGLGAIILFILNSRAGYDKDTLLYSALDKFYLLVNTELAKEDPELGFYRGLSGFGWLLLQCQCYTEIDNDIIHRIENAIELNISSWYGLSQYEFSNGIGGIICFAISRLGSNRFTSDLGFWTKIYEYSLHIQETEGYDEETYFFALQYLSIVLGNYNTIDYIPPITDWLTLPSIDFTPKSVSLQSGELGHELLKSLLKRKLSDV